METIKIVYVDDKHDSYLEKYLSSVSVPNDNVKTIYSEVVFNSSKHYEDFLQDEKIAGANIIYFDSYLFENGSVEGAKITGEEMIMVVKKRYPFIKTFLITQNDLDDKIDYIRKYRSRLDGDDSKSFYDKELYPSFENAVKQIITYRESAKKFNENSSWESVLKEKVNNSLNGDDRYSDLTKEDIDELVRILKGVQDELDV